MLTKASSIERVRKCGRVAHSEHVGISMRGDRAHFTGLTTCGSVWACPICSARIWAERGDELRQAIEAWHGLGGRVALVTLTMRHADAAAAAREGRDHSLSALWSSMGDAWTAARGGYRGSRQALEAAGCAGWARAVEAPHGRNGWHVHVHALMFLAGRVDEQGVNHGTTDADVDLLAAAMFGAWSASLARPDRNGVDRGLSPSREHGVSARLVGQTSADELVGGYLTKATYTEASAAQEVTGGHAKRARGENRTPWAILSALANIGLARDAALWREWEQTSRGKRALTWSQGFRDWLLQEPERTDDEIAEDSDDDHVPIALIPVLVWDAVRDRRHVPALLLEAAESAGELHGFDAVNALLLRECGHGALRPPCEPVAAIAVSDPASGGW